MIIVPYRSGIFQSDHFEVPDDILINFSLPDAIESIRGKLFVKNLPGIIRAELVLRVVGVGRITADPELYGCIQRNIFLIGA